MSRRQTRSFDVRSLSLRDSSIPPLLKTHIMDNVRILCGKVRTRLKRGGGERSGELEISAPFNFKRETTNIPGISHGELALLREKAAASCIRVEEKPRPVSALVIHPAFLSLCPVRDEGDTESDGSTGRRNSLV